MELTVPDPSLVVLVGPAGAGKSTFASAHFKSTEVISSDRCRELVSDDENDMAATRAAFRLLHSILRERLKFGRLAVVDATSVQPSSRKPLIAIARRHDYPMVAIVFDMPENLCVDRNRLRADRNVPPAVIHRQHELMTRSMGNLLAEGFHHVYHLNSVGAVEAASVVRRKSGRGVSGADREPGDRAP